MKAKPYLFCPGCGRKQMSLFSRISNYRVGSTKFQCTYCHTKFRIPGWCSLVQVLGLVLLCLLGYFLAEWMGLPEGVSRLLLTLPILFLGFEALGILLAYRVPFEVVDPKEGPDWEFRPAPLGDIRKAEGSAKRGARKKALRLWLYGALALVCLVVLPALWILPFGAMPVLNGGDLQKALEQQLIQDAQAGQFAVTYEDPGSVRVEALEQASADELTYAHGSLVSDRGAFPFAVLLKKLPFSNRYLYDTRYRLDQLPQSMEDITYAFTSYEVHFYGKAFTVQSGLREFRTTLVLLFPVLWLGGTIAKKFDPDAPDAQCRPQDGGQSCPHTGTGK